MICNSMRLFNRKLEVSLNRQLKRTLSHKLPVKENTEAFYVKQSEKMQRSIIMIFAFALFRELLSGVIKIAPYNERKELLEDQIKGLNKWTDRHFKWIDRIM